MIWVEVEASHSQLEEQELKGRLLIAQEQCQELYQDQEANPQTQGLPQALQLDLHTGMFLLIMKKLDQSL